MPTTVCQGVAASGPERVAQHNDGFRAFEGIISLEQPAQHWTRAKDLEERARYQAAHHGGRAVAIDDDPRKRTVVLNPGDRLQRPVLSLQGAQVRVTEGW
jgi:hypothetical protein